MSGRAWGGRGALDGARAGPSVQRGAGRRAGRAGKSAGSRTRRVGKGLRCGPPNPPRGRAGGMRTAAPHHCGDGIPAVCSRKAFRCMGARKSPATPPHATWACPPPRRARPRLGGQGRWARPAHGGAEPAQVGSAGGMLSSPGRGWAPTAAATGGDGCAGAAMSGAGHTCSSSTGRLTSSRAIPRAPTSAALRPPRRLHVGLGRAFC